METIGDAIILIAVLDSVRDSDVNRLCFSSRSCIIRGFYAVDLVIIIALPAFEKNRNRCCVARLWKGKEKEKKKNLKNLHQEKSFGL